MPKFIAILTGSGLSIESDGGNIVGFFTTQLVKAKNEEEAMVTALRQAEKQWAEDEWSKLNRGGPPVFCCEEISQLGFLESIFKRSPKGYTFYSQE